MKQRKNNKRINIVQLVTLLFLLSFILINSPRGYFFSQYDMIQQVSLSRILIDFTPTWTFKELGSYLGLYSSIAFYIFFSLFSHISFYYIFFLLLTFFTIYLSLKIIHFKDKVLSFIYAFSFFSVYSFFYQGGFSPFHYLYAFFPPIFILFYKYLKETNSHKTNLTLIRLTIVLFLTNIANQNIPYFFSLNWVLAAIWISYYGLKYLKTKQLNIKKTFKKLSKFYLVYFLVTFWSVVPQVVHQARSYLSFITGEQFWDLKQWLFWQAMKFPEPFLMFWDYKRYMDKIPLTVYMALAFPILALFTLVLTKRKRKYSLILWITYIFVIFLANKGVGILPHGIIWRIFRFPLLAPLRSYDKLLVFMPFLLLALIIAYLKKNWNKNRRVSQFIILILFISQVIASYPLWSGQMQTKYSDLHEPGENYKTAKYSGLHIMPEEYETISDKLNQEYEKRSEDWRVMRVPYSVVESPGWVNFPKWKVLGVDPTVQLFDPPTVQMNSFPDEAFGAWNYGELWNSQDKKESSWLLNFTGITNSKYFIFHKDIKSGFVKENLEKMKYYEEQGWITQEFEGEYFNLYKIDEKFFLPHIHIPSEILTYDAEVEEIPTILAIDKFKGDKAFILNRQVTDTTRKKISTAGEMEAEETEIEVKAEMINPTYYELKIKNAKGQFPLIFSETFNSGWQLKKDKGLFWGNVSSADHFMANGYANAWLLDVEELCDTEESICKGNYDGTYDIDLFLRFAPQILYWIGLFISTTTLLWAVWSLLKIKFKNLKVVNLIKK